MKSIILFWYYPLLGSLRKSPTGDKKSASGLCSLFIVPALFNQWSTSLHPGPGQAPALQASRKAMDGDCCSNSHLETVSGEVRCPGAHSGFFHVYYSRHLSALKQKLNGQTSMFLALKEFSLMLMQEKFPSHSCNFIRRSGAYPLLRKKKRHYFLFQRLCYPRKGMHLK